MGIVRDYLFDIVSKQVEENHLIIWFDPEKNYEDFVNELSNKNQFTIKKFEGSYFKLRYDIDPLLELDTKPNLLVYVPLPEEKTHHALIELTTAGVVLKPGQPQVSRNTRLSIIAKRALKQRLGDVAVEEIVKQIEDGKLSLNDLDEIGDRGQAESTGIISIIFGTNVPQEIALLVLGNEEYASLVSEKGATKELIQLLNNTYGITLPDDESYNEIRTRLARHVLCTEFICCIHGELPVKFANVNISSSKSAREACISLVITWRERRDLKESYVNFANFTESELGLRGTTFTIDQIRDCKTFSAIEESMQANVELEFINKHSDTLFEIIQNRQTSFWASFDPEIQARWAIISVAGKLIVQSKQIEENLTKISPEPFNYIKSYTEGDNAWCQIDTYHRNLERYSNTFDFDSSEKHDSLEKLVTRSRQRYMDVCRLLNESYLHSLYQNKFALTDLKMQTDVYFSYVYPALKENKTAYLLIDAFRYEMARELTKSLNNGYNVELNASLAIIPTITELGMAALLPDAENGVKVVDVGEGKLGLKIDGTILKNRKDRVTWIKDKVTTGPGGSKAKVYETKLDDAIQISKTVKKNIFDNDLIFITSQDIDELCESDNVPLARRIMDDILTQLPRAIKALFKTGCKTIIIVADHGYLFADELSSDMKIDPPGGRTADLHRRVWVGQGGRKDEAYLRTPLSSFNLSDELDIAVPWGLGAFKVPGGSTAYFHGGMSLEEMVIPVMIITQTKDITTKSFDNIHLNIALGAKKISTRFVSITVTSSAQISEQNIPRVRIEVWTNNDVISIPISATYGYIEATGDVQLRQKEENGKYIVESNTVALMLNREPTSKLASVHIIDADSGVELARQDNIEVTISI